MIAAVAPTRRRPPAGLVLAARWVASVYLLAAAVLAVLAIAPLVAGWRGNLLVSGSMGARMPPGSILVSAPPRTGDLRPGAVVVVRDPSVAQGALAHRIVRVTPGGMLVLRGDANPSVDATRRHPDDVLGVGRYVVPGVGLPVLWLGRGDLAPLVAWIAATTAALALVSGRRRPSPAG